MPDPQLVHAVAARYRPGAEPPALEALLPEVPPEARPELLRLLLSLECDHRQSAGRPLSAAELLSRFAPLGSWAQDVLASLGLADSGEFLTLEVIAGPAAGRSYQLAGHSTCLVGRDPGRATFLLLDDRGLSGAHFLLEYNPPAARLVDNHSKNGTFVNGRRVEQADLRDGDEVRAGNSTFKVRVPATSGTVTVSPPSVLHTVPPEHTGPVMPGLEVIEELGRGGMGVVLKARRLADDRLVAVKTIHPAVYPSPSTLKRFEREVAILGRLAHPNIVAFLGAGEVAGLLYFVMEYVEGPSAATVVKRDGPMSPERVVTIGCQLLDALAHAHLQGFIHRDVKPGNVLLAEGGGCVKLADFGLGRAYQASAMSGLTVAGTAGGTPEFMPPEQVTDFRGARPAADQYAAGATLYFLLTGQAIYEPAPTTMALMMRILNSEPLPLREQGPPLPTSLAGVLRKALCRDPRGRYADVLAFREALARSL